MMHHLKHTVLIWMSLLSVSAYHAQTEGLNYRVEGKNVCLEISLDQGPEFADSVLSSCGFDTGAVQQLSPGQEGGDHWSVTQRTESQIVLVKDLKSFGGKAIKAKDIQLSGKEKLAWNSLEGVAFDYNKKPVTNVAQLSDGTVRFFLKGYEDATDVFISGTFNQWSTLSHAMTSVQGGWEVVFPLHSGVYGYKFIVDGNWMIDPQNPNKYHDSEGHMNSKIVLANHTFLLAGHTDARKVNLAGTFNNWNERTLSMQKTKTGWKLPVFLRDGTYSYKYVLNGKNWILDPQNPRQRDDGIGNLNSILSLGNPQTFRLEGFQRADRVVLTTSFNNWNQDELVMLRKGGGWEFSYVLPAGNHEYKFIVDGEWITDPDNPVTRGDGDYQNSFIAIGANHVFTLAEYTDVGQVLISGSFAGWPEPGYTMIMNNGRWELPVYLRPGKYTYKFIVEGKWITDPKNSLKEGNGVGTMDSVLWIQ